MKEINRKAAGINTYGKYLGMTIGIVKNNADPMQHGRLQVYVPAYDAVDYTVEDLPWCNYISPFGGVTAEFKVGPEQVGLPGISAYGFWAIPKNSAQVLVGCIDGNPENRFWMGCLFQPEFNRTMPTGINGVTSEIDDSGIYGQHDFPHMRSRLKEAGLDVGDAHFRTRGGYERSISHPSNKNTNKPTDNGYAPKPLEKSKADSQTVSLNTPGRHMFVMSDVDEQCRIRLKTTNGQQIIFDDTNERIYISTGRGKNWIEMDEGNGRIYIYSDSKINIRAKNDLNLYSDENINIRANKRVMIESETRSLHLTAKYDITQKSTHADIHIMASRDLKLKTFNGPKAPPLPEILVCKGPPLDKLYNFEELGGSDTSNIELDAAEQLDITSGWSTIITVNDRDGQGFNLKVPTGSRTINIESEKLNLKGDDTLTVDFPQQRFKGDTIYFDFPVAVWKAGILTNLEAIVPVVSVSDTPSFSPAKTVIYKGHDILKFPFAGEHLPPFPNHPGLMILPDHESWIRDEDIGWCPNRPRNAKYIDP